MKFTDTENDRSGNRQHNETSLFQNIIQKEIIKKNISFKNGIWKKWYFAAVEILAFYVAGYIAQTMNDDPFAKVKGISSNFFTCIWSAITLQPQGIIIIGIITTFGILLYRKIIENTDDLGYEISNKNTYGSANFLTKKEAIEWGKLIHFEKELLPNETGDILGKYNGELIIREAKKGENRNIVVYGSPGAGKSVGLVRTIALQTLRRQESIFFNDPKGEMANSLATMYKNEGYVVRFLNLVNPELSDSWNPLYGLKDDPTFVPIIADIIINGTRKGKASPQEETETVLLRAAIYYVIEEYEESEHTLANVHKLLADNSTEQITALFNAITRPDSYAATEFKGYNKSSPNFSGNVITGVCSRISLFATQLKNITKENEIDLELPGKQKCAYFVILPDQSEAYDFIAASFYATAINKLTKFADAQGCDENAQNIPLPVGVQFMLDEFPNTGKIPRFDKKISTIRSRGISMTLIMQGISQMQRTYDNMEWSSILNCCDVEIVLRTNEPETLEYVSKKTGEASIKVSTEGGNMGSIIKDRENTSDGRRYVMTTDEVRRLKKDEMIIIPSGMNIMKCKKYVFFEHPDRDKIKPYAHSVYHIPKWRKPYIIADIQKNGENSKFYMDESGEVHWKKEDIQIKTVTNEEYEGEENLKNGTQDEKVKRPEKESSDMKPDLKSPEVFPKMNPSDTEEKPKDYSISVEDEIREQIDSDAQEALQKWLEENKTSDNFKNPADVRHMDETMDQYTKDVGEDFSDVPEMIGVPGINDETLKSYSPEISEEHTENTSFMGTHGIPLSTKRTEIPSEPKKDEVIRIGKSKTQDIKLEEKTEKEVIVGEQLSLFDDIEEITVDSDEPVDLLS